MSEPIIIDLYYIPTLTRDKLESFISAYYLHMIQRVVYDEKDLFDVHERTSLIKNETWNNFADNHAIKYGTFLTKSFPEVTKSRYNKVYTYFKEKDRQKKFLEVKMRKLNLDYAARLRRELLTPKFRKLTVKAFYLDNTAANSKTYDKLFIFKGLFSATGEVLDTPHTFVIPIKSYFLKKQTPTGWVDFELTREGKLKMKIHFKH